jgi:hypothetical protein
MRWIRTNRRFGAWCALWALALQIVLSFGHVHAFYGFRLNGVFQVQAADPARQDPASKAASLAAEYCAICAVIKMGAATVPPETPGPGIPVMTGGVQLAPRTEATAWTLAHLLFQARAPPQA